MILGNLAGSKVLRLSREKLKNTPSLGAVRRLIKKYRMIRSLARKINELVHLMRILVWPINWPGYVRFKRERHRFLELAAEANLTLPVMVSYPCLRDSQATTPIGDPHYFYQDAWGAAQVARIKPSQVIDVGSSARLVSCISQFVPLVSVDIRPLPVDLPNLQVKTGTIVDLPFENESIELLMSLCVVEHIGLGRYGDPIDPQGIDKAVAELRRVIRPGGRLVLSVPVGPPCLVFNAQRIFSRQEFLDKFPGFVIEDEIFCDPGYTREDPTPAKLLGECAFYCAALRKG